jgi:SAM-dependent methyltransferase
MKLHLGGGPRIIPGWTHIDERPFTHNAHTCSVHWLPMIANQSCSVVYACHVLEHMRRPQALEALRDWHRVLEPNGVVRIAVPDLRQWCALYLETGAIDLVHGSLFGRQDYQGNTHYQGFDEAKLAADLVACGFHAPRRYDWRETEHAAVDDLSQTYIPHLDKSGGRLMSLNMEALA